MAGGLQAARGCAAPCAMGLRPQAARGCAAPRARACSLEAARGCPAICATAWWPRTWPRCLRDFGSSSKVARGLASSRGGGLDLVTDSGRRSSRRRQRRRAAKACREGWQRRRPSAIRCRPPTPAERASAYQLPSSSRGGLVLVAKARGPPRLCDASRLGRCRGKSDLTQRHPRQLQRSGPPAGADPQAAAVARMGDISHRAATPELRAPASLSNVCRRGCPSLDRPMLPAELERCEASGQPAAVRHAVPWAKGRAVAPCAMGRRPGSSPRQRGTAASRAIVRTAGLEEAAAARHPAPPAGKS